MLQQVPSPLRFFLLQEAISPGHMCCKLQELSDFSATRGAGMSASRYFQTASSDCVSSGTDSYSMQARLSVVLHMSVTCLLAILLALSWILPDIRTAALFLGQTV